MKPKIGQKVTMRNTTMTIIRVYPCGTIDVVDDSGKYYRITGLNFL